MIIELSYTATIPFGLDPRVFAMWTTAFLAAVIAIWGVISQRSLTRRRTTMDLIFGILNDHDYIKARTRFITISKQPNGLLPYAQKTLPDVDGAPDEEGNSCISLVLNNYELLAIGVQRGILDYKILERYMQAIVLGHWKLAASYITELREVYDNQEYYQELETLKGWLDVQGKNKPKGKFWALWF